MPFNTGFILNNRYRIVKLLGQGGFGAVYRAWDTSLNRPCAVKENLELAEESQRQFSREASVLANLNHPSLPRVTDHFILPTGQYLVMDYIDGEDLACMIQRVGKLTWEQAWPWVEQVMRAVTYLHRHNPQIIHRDIKPANIRITPEGQAFLVDFGLVKYFDPNSRTTQGARAVTPGFSPPEQYGQGNTDVRTDIYALAATIYALLTGLEVPESVTRLMDDAIVPVREANPGVPYHVDLALRKAMQIRPADRFASMDQFLQAMSGPVIQQVSPGGAAQGTAVPMQTVQDRVVQKQAAPAAGSVDGQTVPGQMVPGQVVPGQPIPGQAAPGMAGPGRVSPKLDAIPNAVPGAKPAVKKRGFPWVGCLIAAAAVVGLGVLLIMGLYQIGAESQRQTAVAVYWNETQTAVAQQKAEEEARLLTATAAARAEEEARQRTATAAALQATAEAVNAFTGGHSPVYGPVDGNLLMEDDNFVSDASAGLSVSSFITDVTFHNPYDSSTGSWDYGFFFRDQGGDEQYRLIITYDQKWALINRVKDSDGTIVNSGVVNSLETGAGTVNRVTLVCNGSQGWFYVNGKYISPLDLSGRGEPGDISVATGIYSGYKVPGKSTSYTNWRVWNYP